MVRRWLIILALLFLSQPGFAFDQNHSAWHGLLQRHVHWDAKGVASRVDYTAIMKERAALKAYLDELSKVTMKEYSAWSKPQQLAFLINAYNAFTIELILTEYPEVDSIKDLGSLFRSPWQKRFFSLLGTERHLDEIEHEMIRQPGVFDEPRIHVAVVCASIGCPALRDEAFVADRLEGQLEDSLRRFLADRSRNRYNSRRDTLEVSKIFDWYGDDFIGFHGHPSVAAFLGDYAEQLSDEKKHQLRLKAGDTPLDFLEYDWKLNDYRN